MADLANSGVKFSGRSLPRIPVWALGISLSVFLVLTYVLCALFLALFPDVPVSHSFLGLFLPWLEPVTWYSLVTGLIEALVDGWYVALVFGTLYNVVVARFER